MAYEASLNGSYFFAFHSSFHSEGSGEVGWIYRDRDGEALHPAISDEHSVAGELGGSCLVTQLGP